MSVGKKRRAARPDAVLTGVERSVVRSVNEKSAGDPTAPAALALANLTEEILSLRIQGFADTAIAGRLQIPIADVRAVLLEVAKSFKERQWLHYSEFLTVRLQRQESVVSKILKLTDHEDPYVRIAAYGELRKDAEGLAKMFGVDKLTQGGTSVSINLGGTIDPNLYKLQMAMTTAVEGNPALREAFLQKLNDEKKAAQMAQVIELPGEKP